MLLREIREEKGISQKELAGKLGVSPTNIYNYEVGRTEPSIEMLIAISKALEVSVDYLIGNSEDFAAILPAPRTSVLSKKEEKLIKAFNSLDIYQQDFFYSQIIAAAQKNKR